MESSSSSFQRESHLIDPPAGTVSTSESPDPTSPSTSSAVHQQTMFRPPVNRAMRVLDRSFFKKTVPLASATVMDSRNISPLLNELHKTKDLLNRRGLVPVKPVQTIKQEDEVADRKRKCLLLREDIRPDDESTWSPIIQQLVEKKSVEVRPYMLHLDYDYWTFSDIISSVLPEEDLNETPAGFSIVGHVAHLNLRDQYLPYRHLIGEILLDKNPTVKSVINKVDDVGSMSEYRTFAYELLAGSSDLNVLAREQYCDFYFDYSKVYWNSRLSTEHGYMVDNLKEGEAVCDVMAGVGPFAIPAGKKRSFVWANDLNPHGYEMLEFNAMKNKVEGFVNTFNMDGREFIRYATRKLHEDEPQQTLIPQKPPKQKNRDAGEDQDGPSGRPRRPPPLVFTSPRTFDHYIMNLPETAINFLDAFIGVYAGQQRLFHPHTSRRLPLIHTYCFSTNSEERVAEPKEICERISDKIEYKITPEDCETGSGDKAREVVIRPVRLVSPNKMMYCASFRLPPEVAFNEKKA